MSWPLGVPVQPRGNGADRALWEVFHADAGRFAVLALNGFVDLFPVDRNGGRRGDAKADLVTADIDDGDFDIVADHDGFVALAREHEHLWAPSQT
jgi:hypothetical protein